MRRRRTEALVGRRVRRTVAVRWVGSGVRAGSVRCGAAGRRGMTTWRWSGVASLRDRIRIAWSNFSTDRDSESSSCRLSHRGMKYAAHITMMTA